MATIDTPEKECVQCPNALTLDAWLPRLTPARVRCSLPADAVVVRSQRRSRCGAGHIGATRAVGLLTTQAEEEWT